MTREDQFELLKNTLLSEEYEELHRQQRELTELKTLLLKWKKDTREESKEQLEQAFAHFRERFPEDYSTLIAQSISFQVQRSKDELVNALYPLMGTMIKKYIVLELEKISQSVDRQLDIFSVKGIKTFIRARKNGRTMKEQIIMESMEAPQVLQVFVIDSESSLLLGSFSPENTVDKDMVAAMLSAITDFLENAMIAESEAIELLEYQTHKIYIRNIIVFELAFVIEGIVQADFKIMLEEKVIDFCKDFSLKMSEEETNQLLIKHFKSLS